MTELVLFIIYAFPKNIKQFSISKQNRIFVLLFCDVQRSNPAELGLGRTRPELGIWIGINDIRLLLQCHHTQVILGGLPLRRRWTPAGPRNVTHLQAVLGTPFPDLYKRWSRHNKLLRQIQMMASFRPKAIALMVGLCCFVLASRIAQRRRVKQTFDEDCACG